MLQAENVPETAESEAVMQDMIDEGADLIFATSYGHLEFAENLAAENPEVVFVHQGGLESEPKLDNLGTYFGTVYEPVYTAGIAAGQVSETGKLGYVYAFPIPQTLANINAFTLGAQSVNPDIETIAVSTGSWCDPALQAQAAQTLIDQGADVITQHQDCTKTIVEATEAAGVNSVGYHADASELAPNGWITGSEWDWTALYTDIVQTVIDGTFADSDLQRRLPGRPADRRQPVHPVGLRFDGHPRDDRTDRRRQGVVRRRRLAVHRPGRQPGRRHRLGRGRDADLRRHRADGLLRRGRRRFDGLTARSKSIGHTHRRHVSVR